MTYSLSGEKRMSRNKTVRALVYALTDAAWQGDMDRVEVVKNTLVDRLDQLYWAAPKQCADVGLMQPQR
jgi:hypothetical protein